MTSIGIKFVYNCFTSGHCKCCEGVPTSPPSFSPRMDHCTAQSIKQFTHISSRKAARVSQLDRTASTAAHHSGRLLKMRSAPEKHDFLPQKVFFGGVGRWVAMNFRTFPAEYFKTNIDLSVYWHHAYPPFLRNSKISTSFSCLPFRQLDGQLN